MVLGNVKFQEVRTTLREIRKKKGLTLADVSALTGFSKSAICLYELNKRGLSVKKAKVFAEIYGCRWEELYEEDKTDGKTA